MDMLYFSEVDDMTTGTRIRQAREQLGMTQEELGAACGTTKQTIFKYEAGIVTNIPPDRVEKIAQALGLSPSYILGWTDDSLLSAPGLQPVPETVSRPRLGSIACGEPILAQQNIEDYDEIPSWIKCDFTLQCKGNSMIGARIYDGDIVCIRQQPEVENGQSAAVLVEDAGNDSATLKRVYHDGNSVTLVAENPAFPPRVFTGEAANQVKILGVATHFISKLN